MNDKILENTIEEEKDNENPFDSYDLPFDYKFPEDERFNKIFNIENPYDYENMDDFEEEFED